jgi:tRNA (adenine22-N1)-methyltransferase
VAELVGQADVLCDVGCDHGYLPIYLVKNNIVNFAYACDVRQGPIDIAKKNISKYGYTDKIEVIKSDGLFSVRDYKIDIITICGMGGKLISKILSDNIGTAYRAKKVILQPMSEIYHLRKYLAENGFIIDKEILSNEYGRYYNIICAKVGNETNTKEEDYHLGRRLIDDKDEQLFYFFTKKLSIYKSNLPLKKDNDDIDLLNKLIFEIEQILKYKI